VIRDGRRLRLRELPPTFEPDDPALLDALPTRLVVFRVLDHERVLCVAPGLARLPDDQHPIAFNLHRDVLTEYYEEDR
jgi:hypothetical protein